MIGEIGISCYTCANGETWEFNLTIDGHRMGEPLFKTIEGERPTTIDQFEALRSILLRGHAHIDSNLVLTTDPRDHMTGRGL